MGSNQQAEPYIGLTGAQAGLDLGSLPLSVIPEAMLAIDHRGLVVDSNPRAEELFGCEANALRGMKLELLLPESLRAEHAQTRVEFLQAAKHRPMHEGRIVTALRCNGTELPVRVSLSTVRQEGHTYALAAILDATDEMHVITDLQRAVSELEEAQELAKLASWRWNPITDTAEWSPGIYEMLKLDPAQPPPTVHEYLSLVSEADRERVRAELQQLQEQAVLGQPGESELTYNLRDTAGATITVRVIVRPDAQNPGWLHGTAQDVSDVQGLEQELLEQRDLLQRVIESAPVGMAISDADGHYIQVNAALAQMLGRTPEELQQLSFLDVTHPDDRPAGALLNRSFASGASRRNSTHKRYLRADGSTVWADVAFATLTDREGRTTAIVAQVRDLTSELEAADSRARLDAVFGSAHDAMVTCTTSGMITAWNPAAERIFGWTAGEMVGRHISVLAPSDEARQEQQALHDRAMAGETITPLEVRRKRSDGALIDLSMTMSPITAPDGTVVGVLRISRDITAQVAALRALELSRSRLERAEMTGHTGSWEWDLVTGRTEWSAGIYALYGADPDATDVTIEHGLAHRVHPDDRERVRHALSEAVEELRPVFSHHRVIRVDGRVRTVEMQAEPIVDQDGRLQRLIGVVRDVTDAHQVDDRLASASASLASYATELQRLAIRPDGSVDPAAPALSERQLEILRLISRGFTNAQIAQELYLSVPTIKWHVKQILEKTGASNRTEAVARVLGSTSEE